RRVDVRIADRIGQRDRDASHAEIVRWEELKLIALSDRNGFDRDQLRTGGTDETEKRNDETDGPEAGLVHRHLDGKGSSRTIPSETPVASRDRTNRHVAAMQQSGNSDAPGRVDAGYENA